MQGIYKRSLRCSIRVKEVSDRSRPSGTTEVYQQLMYPAGNRYFIIKSWNHENVQVSQRDGTWATQSHNVETFVEAFKTCRNVILVFSVNKSMAFQGYVCQPPPFSSLPPIFPFTTSH